MKDTLFEFTDPNQITDCPLFSHEKQNSNLKDYLKEILLNAEGTLALKRILWVLKEIRYKLDFCPFLIHVTHFLLLLFPEHETYFILNALLDDSEQILTSPQLIAIPLAKKMKFHFTFDRHAFEQY